jgi:hypothetical protein
MKKIALVLIAALLGAAASTPALAHGRGGRVTFGLHVGVPFGWYGWHYPPHYYPYYPPYYYPYYPPQVVYVPSGPQTYIERAPAQAAPAPQAQWWYYCADARAYYPYVRECPGGWQRVAPQPPAN